MYSKDVNRNSAYKEAFPLYHKWGAAGVKIDFMDRDDQDMVNWYQDIIKCAADNKLLVDFHGAYKPDGIIRTYPNMITREGVLGNEYYKFSDKMNPEHNVKLAFTRMLGGPMDYTPGGFLNVTREQFKQQTPTLVWNTRACELAKFVIYESPLTVVCDHPQNILNQPGADARFFPMALPPNKIQQHKASWNMLFTSPESACMVSNVFKQCGSPFSSAKASKPSG